MPDFCFFAVSCPHFGYKSKFMKNEKTSRLTYYELIHSYFTQFNIKTLMDQINTEDLHCRKVRIRPIYFMIKKALQRH